MNKRTEAAAKAIFDTSEYIQTPEYAAEIATAALTAADEVMFSDEAVERAALLIYKAACELAYETDGWASLDEGGRDIWRNDARNVIAALKGSE